MNLFVVLAAVSSAPLRVDLSNSSNWWLFGVQVVAASVTVAAVVYAARAARAANRSVQVATAALDHEQVRDLSREFDKHGYFLRFWRLDMLTRDLEGVRQGGTRLEVYTNRTGHPLTGFAIGPSALGLLSEQVIAKADDLKNRLAKGGVNQLVLDALGPESSPNSADFLAVYWFSLKLEWFVESDRNARADALTRAFGYQLVVTLIRHRTLAARLLPGRGSKWPGEYYGQAYGLNDARYADLVTSLFIAVARQKLLLVEELENLREREAALTPLGYVGADLELTPQLLFGLGIR
jgi:hypothetical protein